MKAVSVDCKVCKEHAQPLIQGIIYLLTTSLVWLY